MKKLKCGIEILIISLVIFGTGCSKKNVVVPESIKNVKVATVSNSSIETDIKYSSKLAALRVTDVTSKVTSKIDSVNLEVGQPVKKGDILFTVDAKELKAQYDQAKGVLDTAQANLIKTSDSAYLQQLIQAKSSADVAQNSCKDALNNYNTIHQQYTIGDSSKDDLDTAKSKLDSATSQLSAANESLDLIKSKLGPEANAAAAAQVEQSQGALDLAQIQINNSTITSPIDGIVSARNIEIGEMVSSAITAFTVIDTSNLLAEVPMTDKDVIKVKAAQKIPVQITSMDNKSVEGTVDTISPTADAKTQLYTVKLKLDNKDNSLKTGMIVRVIFPDEIKNNIPVVPNGAIFTENSVQYVYKVEDNKIKKTEVVVGISDITQTEIASGLKLGDSVITEGQSFLNDGQKVSVTK